MELSSKEQLKKRKICNISFIILAQNILLQYLPAQQSMSPLFKISFIIICLIVSQTAAQETSSNFTSDQVVKIRNIIEAGQTIYLPLNNATDYRNFASFLSTTLTSNLGGAWEVLIFSPETYFGVQSATFSNNSWYKRIRKQYSNLSYLLQPIRKQQLTNLSEYFEAGVTKFGPGMDISTLNNIFITIDQAAKLRGKNQKQNAQYLFEKLGMDVVIMDLSTTYYTLAPLTVNQKYAVIAEAGPFNWSYQFRQ